MSYLLNDMNESYSFKFGIYFKTVPLYNHTTKSLLLRNFKIFKSVDLIEHFLMRSKSGISYSKMIEIFEMRKITNWIDKAIEMIHPYFK